jgi:hypothetical protein
MLSQIPGVSTNIANSYVKKYGTIANFISILGNVEKGEAVKILGEEKYGASNRRVGDKVGDKIYKLLFL